ncbi:GreA/GreB family elongation factor [Sphingobium sp. AN641]|uniref:GreA/GreB family elongation factor n=1 Tax=Sphingobium sp. AN641 TaxID=3133443 RepID=UPI0030BC7388
MSVAFRRESDEEHLEPTFELPIPPGPNRVTARGLALTQAKVAALEAAVAAQDDEEARKTVQRALRYWRTRLATAQVMPAAEGVSVSFGARVTYRRAGQERRIDIVGDDEAEPAAGRIAFSAPLARAMMGAQAGEQVDFGGGAIDIVAVEPIPPEDDAARQ